MPFFERVCVSLILDFNASYIYITKTQPDTKTTVCLVTRSQTLLPILNTSWLKGRFNQQRTCGFATYDIGCANDQFGLQELCYFLGPNYFFYVFDETFFLRFWPKFLRFWWNFANFIWWNFICWNCIWRRLATSIHSLALPGSTLLRQWYWFFQTAGQTHTHTNKHTLAQLYYR